MKKAAPLPGQADRSYQQFTTERPTFANDDLLRELIEDGASVRATPLVQQRGFLTNLLISFAPILLLVAFYVWMFKRQQGAMAGGLLGGGKQKRVDPETVRVTFEDVAGIDEVEAEINEVVDFLKDPEKYRRLGARAPKGVLLTGAPGTGKTLLARATAGEAKVPFFSASASEFIEMIVGVGASRVRDLFSEARKVAPAIIFIDEIDTIGRARGGARSFGGHDEREQTLNQILTEMDGFSGHEGVVVLAATNRPDVLDPALLRPGRFDRQIIIHPPDQKGRVEILKVHTRKCSSRRRRRSGTDGFVDTRHDRRGSRESGQRSRSPGGASQSGRGASARPDGRAREGSTGHRAERSDPRRTTTPDRIPRSRSRACSACSNLARIPFGRSRSSLAAARWASRCRRRSQTDTAMTRTIFAAGSLARWEVWPRSRRCSTS